LPASGRRSQAAGGRPARRLDHHAVREAELRSLAEERERCRHGLRVLKNEVAMVEQHVDRARDARSGEPVHRIENP
jgi:hypothetical protein